MRLAIQSLSLTAGQVHDVTQAEPLLEDLAPQAVIADKGYDSDAFVDRLEARDITPVIPLKKRSTRLRSQ